MSYNTENGLLLISIALTVNLALMVISFLVGFPIGGLIREALLLAYLFGYVMLFMGRKEYGERHKKLVPAAIIVYLFSIFLILFGWFIIFSSTVLGDGQGIQSALYVVIWASVITAISHVLLLHELENRAGRFVLYLFLGFGVLAALYLSAIQVAEGTLQQAAEVYLTGEGSMSSAIASLDGVGMAAILEIVKNAILILAYIIPYMRIRKNELISSPDKIKIRYETSPYPHQGYPSQSMEYELPAEKTVRHIPGTCIFCGATLSTENQFCQQCGGEIKHSPR